MLHLHQLGAERPGFLHPPCDWAGTDPPAPTSGPPTSELREQGVTRGGPWGQAGDARASTGALGSSGEARRPGKLEGPPEAS